MTRQCDNPIYDGVVSVAGTFLVKDGGSSDLIATNFPWRAARSEISGAGLPVCDVRFDVTDNNASVLPNQSCYYSGYIRCSPTCVTGKWTLSFNTLTMTLETDNALVIVGTGDWVSQIDEYVSLTCAETLSARALTN